MEIAIGPGDAEGRFRVEVVNSPAGEASALTKLDTQRLLARRDELQRAVLLSAVRTRRVLTEDERCVREVGQELFTALLGSGEAAGRYQASAAISVERGERLQVVLRISSPALAGLPWEAMYDEAMGEFVCRRTQLVRHVSVPALAAPLMVSLPLRILGVISIPRGLPRLDTGKEKELLGQALAGATGAGVVQMEWAPSASWEALQEMLLDGPWHVLHFIGHGEFDYAQDEGVLALTGADGRALLVTASQLVDLLSQANPVPRLVVLNSCSGAASGVTDLFSGTAAALVRGGVSAVAAMQYEISDPAAVAFCQGFYAALARGRGVDEAVSNGRVAIVGLNSQTLEWVTPVLYQRGHNSHLFAVAPLRLAPPVVAGQDAPEHKIEDNGTVAQDQPRPPLRPPLRGPSVLVSQLTGHTERGFLNSGIMDVAFNADGTLLASAGGDKTVRIWERATEIPIRTLTGRTSSPRWSGVVYGVTFTPDGTLLATAGSDGIVRLWEAATATQVRSLNTHTDWVKSVAFSPDGTLRASVGREKNVRIWETATGTPLRILTGHTGKALDSVAFSPDGILLASAGEE